MAWAVGALWGCLFLGCGGAGSAPGATDAATGDATFSDARPSPDGGLDAGRLHDSGTEDAGIDAGQDAGFDAGHDGGIDAGPRLGPPYPIVLAHGFMGFEDFAGAGFLDYFHGVVPRLESEGETLVFTPTVDPFQNSEVRGEQLRMAIEGILAETGHAKVNIIAHSQGGLDARYVASMSPELVATVTTVSTPHRGTPLIDLVLRVTEEPRLRGFVDDLVRLIGAPLYDEIGEETSLFEALRQLSQSGAQAFNEAYPDAPGVRYYSYAGRTDNALARRQCDTDFAPDYIRDVEWVLDPVDPLLALSEALFDGTFWARQPNDGLVTIESAKWGVFLGCIPADHLDEIGQLFGDRPGLLNRWRHRDFYVDAVGYLRREGY